jgi:hypothetical protein
MGDVLDDPEPCTSRQARAAGQHAESRSEPCVRQLRQSGLLSQHRIGFPDNVTFNDLQPRMLCTVCNHRGADVGPSWLHHG